MFFRLNFVIVTLCMLGSSDAYNILCLLPYPGKSHHIMFESLIQELTNRGHNLTVVSFFPAANPKENRRDVSLVGLSSLNIEILDFDEIEYSFFGLETYFQHVPPILKLAKLNLALCEKILDAEVFDEFLRAEGYYDVILVEHFNSDCMLGVAHSYGAPSVGLISSTMLPWTLGRVGAPDNPAYVPGMTLQLTDDMSLLERLENTFYLHFYNIWYWLSIRLDEQRLLERKLGRPLPALDEIAKNASVVLVNTHHSLHGVRVAPPAIVEVGGIHLHNHTVIPLPHDLRDWMNGAESGVIVFSFGSLIRGSSLSPERFKIFTNVFDRLPQRVIWKWEDNILQELPKNVMITKWLPQYDLLNHPNCVAFITHGGLLSMTEAVDAGVPMLVIPLLGDQFGNAAHATRAGVAVTLRLQHLDETTLYNALQMILTTKMLNQAKNLEEEWRDRSASPMATAVYWVEWVARHKNTELASPSRHLPSYQILLLDVYAIYCTGILLFIFTIYKTIRFLCKCLTNSIKQKQS